MAEHSQFQLLREKRFAPFFWTQFLGAGNDNVYKNALVIFMSVELQLNAVNLAFVAFSQAMHKLDGQVFVLFVIVVAAAEAAVGLAIIILTARNRQSLNVERVDLLKL